ncbi:MAG TPA: methyltransferase domain-containing protein [Chitinophagaceae bacterium]|jgi:2-polyprenyl-3-methyl-5-hydroxy-6-metoxy-1,4-benzoquinol methylase|nr:methyltransferase domain-containing protein [Chitinophagaceae bacterium]
MNNEQQIIESWKANAGSWISILEENGIESRKLATNKAIVDAICTANSKTVLDIGCGEGWLAKELSEKGMELTGIDVIPELVNKARQHAKGEFIVASYEDIFFRMVPLPSPFDVVVINFALIGKESTEKLLSSLPHYMASGGKLFIQTLHPYTRKETDDYTSGWKEGSWTGLGDSFTLPYQWYFRTLEDWLELLGRSGFSSIKVTDVLHPHSDKQLSVIFECSTGKTG